MTSPSREEPPDATCFLERSKVRDIIIGLCELGDMVSVLKEVDALPIFTAADFGGAAQAPNKHELELAVWEFIRELRYQGLIVSREAFAAVEKIKTAITRMASTDRGDET